MLLCLPFLILQCIVSLRCAATAATSSSGGRLRPSASALNLRLTPDGSCNRCGQVEPGEVHRELLYNLKESESWNLKSQRLLRSILFMYIICLADFFSIVSVVFSFSKQTSWVGVICNTSCTIEALLSSPFRRLIPHWGSSGLASEGRIYGKARKIMASSRSFCYSSLFVPFTRLIFFVMATTDGGWVCSCSFCFGNRERFLGIKRCPLLM